MLRLIERALYLRRTTLKGRDKGLAVHGNRFLSHIVFKRLSPEIADPGTFLPEDAARQILGLVDAALKELQAHTHSLFPQAYPATLFKNQRKLSQLAKTILQT